MKRFALLLGVLSGCVPARRPTPPPAPAHYVGEDAWRGDGVWFYPRERYEGEQTGIASVYPASKQPRLTTDGEVFSQDGLTAAYQTIQLPAVLRVINLETGREILVWANDHGPSSPHRLIQLTRRAATLLGIAADGTARVRVRIDGDASRRATDQLGGGAPKLALAAVPHGTVQVESLDGARTVGTKPAAAPTQPIPALTAAPGTVTLVPANPGTLWIRLGEFSRPDYARRQSAAMAPYGQVEQVGTGRHPTYRVKAGPFPDLSVADAALDRALHAGLTDARIVVE